MKHNREHEAAQYARVKKFADANLLVSAGHHIIFHHPDGTVLSIDLSATKPEAFVHVIIREVYKTGFANGIENNQTEILKVLGVSNGRS